jgi:putative ABC transport system substrate-binding protein
VSIAANKRASLIKVLHRLGFYMKEILDGANPGDLPVEQPTKLELINLKTAKTLRIEIHRLCSPAPTRSSNEAA